MLQFGQISMLSKFKITLDDLKDVLPPIYAALAIVFVSAFFIFQGNFGDKNTITNFSITSIIVFLLTHIFSFGNDQSLLATEYEQIDKRFRLDLHLLTPLVSLVIIYSTLGWLYNLEFMEIYLNKFINVDKDKTILAFSAIVFFALISKTLSCYFIVNSKQNHANLFYLYKSLSLGLSLALFCFDVISDELAIFVLMEMFSCVLLVLTLIFTVVKSRLLFQSTGYNYRYIFGGLNVFGYDSLLKLDLVILSVFLEPALIAPYAIISSVFEGLSQAISSLQFNYSKHLLLFRDSVITKTSFFSAVASLFKFGVYISFLFIPGCLIFLYIVLGEISALTVLIICFLQLSLTAASKSIIAFFTLSLLRRPALQFFFMIVLILLNVIISYWLFIWVGMVGVAIGSLIVFSLMHTCANLFFNSTYLLR